MAITVNQRNIAEASGGNQALSNVLKAVTASIEEQQQATATAAKDAPSQQAATVSFENPLFIVTFTAQQAQSTQQAAQQATLGANGGSSIIYNQVRAATSVMFDAQSQVQTFGGSTGLPQAQFVLSGLDVAEGWYFQVRSSYDGKSWNRWKTINGGKAVMANANAVTYQSVGIGAFAMMELPGSQVCGFGVEALGDSQYVLSAPGTPLENTFAIPAPSGFTDTGHQASGIKTGTVNTQGMVTETYVDGEGNTWPSSVSCLLFGWGTKGQKVKSTAVTGGNWAIFELPGGAQFAVGSGSVASGSNLPLPSGFSVSNMMGIASPAGVNATANPASGVLKCEVSSAGVCTCEYADASGNTWTGNCNWFAVAWTAPLQANIVATSNGQFLEIWTPSGKVAVGMGSAASGDTIALPSGYSFKDSAGGASALGFASPRTFASTSNVMHGIQICSVNAEGQTILIYEDGGGHQWNGNVNWFCVAWKN